MIGKLRNLERATQIKGAIIISLTIMAALLAPYPAPFQPGEVTAEARPPIPVIPVKKPAEWSATLRRNNPWDAGQAVEAAEGAAQQRSWNIVGIIIHAGTRFALVNESDGPSRKVRVGDKLPDGSVIIAIDEDRLQVRQGHLDRIVNIYRQ